MVSFEIYKKEIEIVDGMGNKAKYMLRPLSGRFMPKLYGVIKKFETSKSEEGTIDNSQIDESAMGDIHFLLLETFKKSYPKEDEEVLDEFCSQNLMKLLEGLIEVNLGKPDES